MSIHGKMAVMGFYKNNYHEESILLNSDHRAKKTKPIYYLFHK